MGWSGPVTHRQFVAWVHWLQLDADVPDRTDNYLMQIACEVRRVLAKDPSAHRLEHFKLKFGDDTPVGKADVKIERQLVAMARSLASRGGFTREQIREMVSNARARLEGKTDG